MSSSRVEPVFDNQRSGSKQYTNKDHVHVFHQYNNRTPLGQTTLVLSGRKWTHWWLCLKEAYHAMEFCVKSYACVDFLFYFEIPTFLVFLVTLPFPLFSLQCHFLSFHYNHSDTLFRVQGWTVLFPAGTCCSFHVSPRCFQWGNLNPTLASCPASLEDHLLVFLGCLFACFFGHTSSLVYQSKQPYIHIHGAEFNSCMWKYLSAGVSTNPLSALDSCRRNHRPIFALVECSHWLVSNWMSCLPSD